MPCKIYVDLDFALPNGQLNPTFKPLWEKYVFLAGPPKRVGNQFLFEVSMKNLVSLPDLLTLVAANENNEMYSYGITVELTSYKYNNNTVPSWVQDSEILDEDGVGTGAYKKWKDWKPDATLQWGTNYYLPEHLFNNQIGLKGSELVLLNNAGYTLKSDDEYRAIVAANTPSEV